MSREIKFRAWNKTEKKMYQVVDMYFGKSGELQTVRLLADHNGMQYPTNDIPVCEVELMQYAGMNDKNGVEIYEGDWVTAFIETPPSYSNPDDNIHLIQGRVFFDVGCFLFGNGNYLDGDHIWDLEIIGNIHENPELLEAK